ncbi:MAG: hypothetical protein ABR974_12870 [Bacteroidales bacterium]|jgi:hypothetical protein
MTISQWNKSLSLGLLFFLSISYVLYGQNDTNNNALADTGSKGSAVFPKNSLFATAGFGSNMIFLGSTISQNRPFYSTGLVYGFRNSIYLSASATHIEGMDPFLAYYSAAADYKHTFNSWFDISAEISGYKPAPSLEQTLFNEFIFANFTAGFDWKILYTRISTGALFSENTTGYIQVSNSRYFQTPEFFKGRSYISFNPEINMLFGDIGTLETTTGERQESYTPPFLNTRKDPPPSNDSYSSRFGPMNFEFSLPVTLNYSKFSLEADPCYILPAFRNSTSQVPQGFTIYITASFRLFQSILK